MPILIRLVLQYALLGLSTAFTFVTSPATTTPVVETHLPQEELPFLFEQPIVETPPQYVPETFLPPKPSVPTTIPQPVVVPAATKPVVKEPEPTPTPAPKNSVEDAVVNIICIKKVGTTITSTTGSGVIVSSSGVILTNAHVAVDVLKSELLDDRTCTIRTAVNGGSNFRPEALYIPPTWIQNNASIINGLRTKSVGQLDYALLEAQTSQDLPFVPVASKGLQKNDKAITVGFPAGQLSNFTPFSKLLQVKDTVTITGSYSLGITTSDIITTSESDAAHEGSSGGAVTNSNGELAGIILSVNGSNINALTLSYIMNVFQKSTDVNFKTYIENPRTYDNTLKSHYTKARADLAEALGN
jgi:hypothetical protein